jgi:peroxiredoxin Q/BCP
VLHPGTPAPDFTLPDQDGRPVSLHDHRGRWVLVWWYPKGGTPGCTLEGQGLRDRADAFRDAGCDVLGVSFDTPQDNAAFARAQGFAFSLLADLTHDVGRAYGVVREGDERYAGFAQRISYLVDPEGMIRKAYRVADVVGHADEVLADLAALGAHA